MARLEQEIMDGWEFTLKEPLQENFRPVDLPHDWAVNAPFSKTMDQGPSQGYRDRWGIGWYRKSLDLPVKKEGYLYFLDFGGIYENSTVWVNGKEAGGHKYGYSSFRLDVTSFVKEGENEILIRVDNTQSPVDRWYSGCGIYRMVKWLEMPVRHLEDWDIVVHTAVRDGAGLVKVETGLLREMGELRLKETAGQRKPEEQTATSQQKPERQVTASQRESVEQMASQQETVKAVLRYGSQVYEASGDGGSLEIMVPNARLWSAEEPNLYTLTVQLLDGDNVLDEVTQRIGIREFTFDSAKGMLVNGNPVKLKGVCLHQEAGCRGIAVKKEIWRQRLIQLKEMGCNAIRAAHHTHSMEFLDLCDEMGFYVYEECFDKWTGGLYGRYFATEWKKDVEAMVKRDRNRACICIWGVGNEVENQAQDSMLEILSMLRSYVLTLDDTRPVSYAMNPHFKRESNIDVSKIVDIQKFVDEADDTEIYDAVERVGRIKRIAQIVDIISCNYQEQWYDMIHEAAPDKLILGTEVYQYFKGHRDQMQNFTDENPNLTALEKDYCIGSMIWTGYDYLGESMGWPAKGWSGAMIRTNLERRPSFYILQSYWSDKPMVHFAVMDYSLSDEGVKEHWDIPIYVDHWHFPQFHKTLIPYMIASNCDEVALYLNGKRFHVPAPAQCPNRVITGFLPWQPGVVKAVGYKNGEEVCTHEIRTPGPAVQLSFDQETVHVPAKAGYELLLSVHAKDEEGNPYFRESAKVRFCVEGPAEIVGVDAGDLMSNEPYGDDSIHMYHGCASVVIRLDGTPGRVAVSAYADGMRSARVVVCVQ